MDKILGSVAAKLWQQVQPWADAKTDELVDKYLPIVTEKLIAAIVAAVPVATATAVKTVLDADPDIPGVSDVFDLSETIRKAINSDQGIPFNIPLLSDIMKGLRDR